MKRRLVLPATALAVLVGSAVALAVSDSTPKDPRVDVDGATFGQFMPEAGTNPDWIQIAWPGPDGETLYVSSELIAAGSAAMPAIDKSGFIVGTLEPGRGLVIGGKPTATIDPPSTSYLTVP